MGPPGWPARLERDDLVLRALRMRDASAWSAVRAANAAWLGPWEATSPDGSLPPASFPSLVRALAHQGRTGTSMPFVLEVRGRLAGQVTVGAIEWGSLRSANIGYWLDARLAGQGIMPRAVAMVVDHCFGVARLHRLEVNIRPENAPSRRVAEKLGLRHEGVRRAFLHIAGDWRDHDSYAITAPEVPEGMYRRVLAAGTAHP